MIDGQIEFGALSPKLSEQLRGKLPHHVLRSFDKFADAIVLLSVHGVLSDAETHRARQRIVKAINRKYRGGQP